MEVNIQNIELRLSGQEIEATLASILHKPPYTATGGRRMNFDLQLFPDWFGVYEHTGCASLTLPTSEAGDLFLDEFSDKGSQVSEQLLESFGPTVVIQKSTSRPRTDTVLKLAHFPYVGVQSEMRDASLRENLIPVRAVQFGWEGRDGFSIEWEHQTDDGWLMLVAQRQEMRVSTVTPRSFAGPLLYELAEVGVRYSNIRRIHSYVDGADDEAEPSLFFRFWQPPYFEALDVLRLDGPWRERWSCFDFADHERIAPYASLAMRLVLKSDESLTSFRKLCAKNYGNLRQQIHDTPVKAVRNYILSSQHLGELKNWTKKADWGVAYQIESLVRGLTLSVVDMLALRPKITEVISKEGDLYASKLLQHFHSRLRMQHRLNAFLDPEHFVSLESIFTIFDEASEQFSEIALSDSIQKGDDTFEAYHVWITPTSMQLEGPFSDRSNRVVRLFDRNHHKSFIRVSFVDEGRVKYKTGGEVYLAPLLKLRIRDHLVYGIDLAGRHFQFLAYSSSALKEHTVWFVKAFTDTTSGRMHTAESIISNIGDFDESTMFCPAKYAARISQALTATDASVTIEAENVLKVPDILSANKIHSFTDGVGTVSPELCLEIWQKVQRPLRREGYERRLPKAFQIRLGGSKGMIRVDDKLKGRTMCLPKSMFKFHAPDNVIEIVQVFNQPLKYFLNRYIITVLEGLGVPYKVFQHFQDKAVSELNNMRQICDLKKCGETIKSFGLGASFRLPSSILALNRLGIVEDHFKDSSFFRGILELSHYHALRGMKTSARIPVPGAWTLVGVCDIHRELKEDQIYACIRPLDNEEVIYLDGPCLISRSPTIHPGDIQVVYAIGQPSVDSCFYKERLPNMVVFSVTGQRPISSKLGGGDMDGDLYNIIPLKDPRHPKLRGFYPKETHSPAPYQEPFRHILDRPATVLSVIDFFEDYVKNENIGIISNNWLITADQSREYIFDQDCYTLAALHSEAVDYPKTGFPVQYDRNPRSKSKKKPDWVRNLLHFSRSAWLNASNLQSTFETLGESDYESHRAIGRLFRAIKLPAVDKIERAITVTSMWNQPHFRRDPSEKLFWPFVDEDQRRNPFLQVIYAQVKKFIDPDRCPTGGKICLTIGIFERYASELQAISASNTINDTLAAYLTEEEIVVGTILHGSSQGKERKRFIQKLKNQTDSLVRRIRNELSGLDNKDKGLSKELENAWVAFLFSFAQEKQNRFASRSFWWISLGLLLDALKSLEDALNDRKDAMVNDLNTICEKFSSLSVAETK